MLLNRFAGKISVQKQAERQAKLYRDFLRHESRVGGEIFGPLPSGVRREFVCLDQHTWVWYEEWTDNDGRHQACTTRYDVRPSGIIKSQNGQYYKVDDEEAKRLVRAAYEYYRRVKSDVYSFAG